MATESQRMGEEILMNFPSAKDKLILALDVDLAEQARKIVDELLTEVGLFKVGKELFTRTGFDLIYYIQEKGGRVFLDLKYHDIPTTVKRAARAASELGVAMFNVHASGGLEMMRAAVEGARLSGRDDVIVLGVTVLTSMDEQVLKEEIGVEKSLQDQVVHLAKLSREAGLNGVVASPQEIAPVRRECGGDFVIVTPGVRPVWATMNDQKRTMTPHEAVQAGADYIVVGRPVLESKNPKKAVREILKEML